MGRLSFPIVYDRSAVVFIMFLLTIVLSLVRRGAVAVSTCTLDMTETRELSSERSWPKSSPLVSYTFELLLLFSSSVMDPRAYKAPPLRVAVFLRAWSEGGSPGSAAVCCLLISIILFASIAVSGSPAAICRPSIKGGLVGSALCFIEVFRTLEELLTSDEARAPFELIRLRILSSWDRDPSSSLRKS